MLRQGLAKEWPRIGPRTWAGPRGSRSSTAPGLRPCSGPATAVGGNSTESRQPTYFLPYPPMRGCRNLPDRSCPPPVPSSKTRISGKRLPPRGKETPMHEQKRGLGVGAMLFVRPRDSRVVGMFLDLASNRLCVTIVEAQLILTQPKVVNRRRPVRLNRPWGHSRARTVYSDLGQDLRPRSSPIAVLVNHRPCEP